MNIDKFLLFDGAIGTYYANKNRPYSLSQANLLDYNTIVSIHKEYISSGAMAITTNTFGVENVESIRAAINAAYDAARNTDIKVFASIGPIMGLEYIDYLPIVDTMIDCGINNFIMETFPAEEIVIELATYIKTKLSESFIITSFAVDQNGYTAYGKYYNNIISKVKVVQAIDSYGFNCVCGPVHMREIASKIDTSDIISIMPNAGYPTLVGGKAHYTDNPEYFAEKLLEIHRFGVKILGGCCGTTPKHIEQARKLLDTNFTSIQQDFPSSINKPVVREENKFKDILNNGRVIIIEYDPPLNANAEEISKTALMYEKAGADAISIADNPLGRARADSLLVASRIMRDTKKITVIPHLTCRDRNTISIRSALMGLNIEGIHNILCITGDPIPSCNLKEIKGVFSFNSYSLLGYVENINQELIYGDFFPGAALNVNANHFHLELDRARKKLASGAKYFITQPCYSMRSVNNALLAKEMLKSPIIAGIMPIKSFRNASFIQSEISGIEIPDEVVELYRDKSPEQCEDISIKFSIDIMNKLDGYINGFHLITPPKGEKIIARIIKEYKQK